VQVEEERHVDQGDVVKSFERRYHATWLCTNGLGPLARLAQWMCTHPGQLAIAPQDLLIAAANDVGARLPAVAAREPTRRHRKHFAWLLGWQLRLADALNFEQPETR
jgi:hypothetical protein